MDKIIESNLRAFEKANNDLKSVLGKDVSAEFSAMDPSSRHALIRYFDQQKDDSNLFPQVKVRTTDFLKDINAKQALDVFSRTLASAFKAVENAKGTYTLDLARIRSQGARNDPFGDFTGTEIDVKLEAGSLVVHVKQQPD